MGRGSDKKSYAAKGKEVQKDKKQGKKDVKFVPRYHYFAKSKLAAYPSAEGTCFYMGKNQGEKDFFKLKNILKSRDSSNEELCRRLGMGLVLDAASAHHGAEVLQKHFQKAIPAVPKEQAAQLEKTGLPKLLEELATEEGKEFVNSLSVLNVGKTGQPTEAEVKTAVKTFVAYLQDPRGTLHRSLTRLASDAAGLYLFAMTLLKDMALVQDPKGWADKVEGAQPEAIKAWRKKPTDEKKLRQALVAALMAKVQENEPAPNKRRKVSDSSEASAASKAVGSSDEKPGSSGNSSAPAGKKSSESEGNKSSDKSSGKSSAGSSSSKSKKSSRKKNNKEKSGKDTSKTKTAKKEKKDTKKQKSKDEKQADRKAGDKDKKKEEEKKKAEAARKKEEKEREEREREEAAAAVEQARQAAEAAKTAAFTAWPQGDAQALLDTAEAAKGSIGLMTGKFKKEKLLEVARTLPLDVISHFPEVEQAIGAVVALDADMVPNTQAKPVLSMVIDITTEALAFRGSQGETASASKK